MADPGDWKTEVFRRKVITQIEEALRNSNTQMNKSSVEMENHVFNKAKSRDEYLALVARLILYVKDNNSQRNKQMPIGIMGGMPQQQMAGGGMPGQMGNIQDPINALQSMAMTGPGMGQPQSTGMIGGGQPMTALQQQQRQQMINQLQQQRFAQQQQQQQQQPQQPQQSQMQRPHLQRQDAFIVTATPPVQAMSSTQQAQVQQMNVNPQVSSNAPQPGTQASPAPQSNPQQMVGSPMGMMTSPSTQIVPSPGARPIGSMGAPSPSTALNTPGNPGSVGTEQSPASQSAEDQAYMEKLKSLYKFIDPLRRMIKKTEEGKADQRKATDINKLKNLYDILTNPSKRVPMSTLAKCETVLEKVSGAKIARESTPAVAPPPAPQVHMCQPLLDSVASHIVSPSFNHTLHRTFGPSMAAIFGNPIRPPSPPSAKRAKLDDKSKIPDILQGEIARLDRRFRVKMDPIHHAGSKDIHLVCKLEDDNLPCVPPILITIPHDYPENSPECSTSRKDYDSTPFLQAIQKSLVTHLVDLPSKFTFTSMLDMWEMSVRKACMPS
ncbi:mediator complex subunit Med15 [Mactra antiquata]